MRPGGSIILAAECCDGIPDGGNYVRLLREASGPAEVLTRIHTPGSLELDQWEAQVQAQVQAKATVYLYSHLLSDEQIRGAHLLPCRAIEATVRQLLRESPTGSICVSTGRSVPRDVTLRGKDLTATLA